MSVTSGFYNSANHDRRYDAKQFGQLFDGLITDGIYHSIGKAFAVSVNSGMTLNVESGRAWFNHTWTYNDTVLVVDIPDAHSVYSRYDAVVLRIDTKNRENSIAVKSGTAGSEPIRPTMENGPDVYEHPLAYVFVEPNVTTIKPAAIDQRIGSEDCPFVTGIFQGVSIDKLLKNWTDEFDILYAQLNRQISQASSGTLIDKSVTYEKLANDAVRVRFFDISVQPSDFFENSTYQGLYPYRASIKLNSVDAAMVPDVVFSVESIDDIDLAPVAECYDGGVYIYADRVPTEPVSIRTITCFR